MSPPSPPGQVAHSSLRSSDISDVKFNLKGKGPSTPKDYYENLVSTRLGHSTHSQMDTFECLYDEGVAGEPKMMTILLHPHIIGHGSRMYWLEQWVEPKVLIADR